MMLGFIGTGNMAQAIINGILNVGFLKADGIAAFDTDSEKLNSFCKDKGIEPATDCEGLISYCDTVVLAVKPTVLGSLLNKYSGDLKGKLVVSIAAGKSLSFYESFLGKDARTVRVMPNINAVVGEAISAFCAGNTVSDSEKGFVRELLSSFGKAIELPEDKFSIFSAIGGCSPAFAYMFIDSMARAAVKNGMSKSDALMVSAQAVLGSAKMILESGVHPWELIDRVCSPGGTTIEGVLALEEAAFPSAVENAVDASFEKDKKL